MIGNMTRETHETGRFGRNGECVASLVHLSRLIVEISLTLSGCQVSLYTLIPPLASSMMAPGLPNVAEKLHITSDTLLAMTLSIFLLTFAIGPLFMAPLSEIYGRTWVLHISNLVFLAFNLGTAFAPTTGILIGMRIVCECRLGSVPCHF
jgi:MFS family permease